MNIPTLKEKFLSSLDTWTKERLDTMASTNPNLVIPSVYLKRGCHNLISKYKENIGKGIDNAALFFADEEGNIDINTLFTDGMEMFKGMEESPFDTGLIQGVIGKGKVSIALPDNILTNLVFGNKKTLTFHEEDFIELKNLLTE